MAKDIPFSAKSPVVQAAARRVITEYGVRAGAFASGQVKAAQDAGELAEAEMWDAITAEVRYLLIHRRV